MDQRITDCIRERPRRPVRNKRYARRIYSEEKRPPKRLFTPEIKRFLKDWLIRRRDNPYPNRDEKKTLAVQTGLTYIQVCNWFANWRRKLKNSGKEPQKKSWGYLIKSYNSQVQGNVEHFSISSEDSIWQEADVRDSINYDINNLVSEINDVNVSKIYDSKNNSLLNDYNYNINREKEVNYFNKNNNNSIKQYCSISSFEERDDNNPFSQNTNKYKNHIIEKYLRDCQKPENYTNDIPEMNVIDEEVTKPSMISKWLQSATNFKPSENNYLNWTFGKTQKKRCKKIVRVEDTTGQQHGKEELDAAEALTRLASASSSIALNL